MVPSAVKEHTRAFNNSDKLRYVAWGKLTAQAQCINELHLSLSATIPANSQGARSIHPCNATELF